MVPLNMIAALCDQVTRIFRQDFTGPGTCSHEHTIRFEDATVIKMYACTPICGGDTQHATSHDLAMCPQGISKDIKNFSGRRKTSGA